MDGVVGFIGDNLFDLFRHFMFFIDNVVYGLIPTIYKLFIYLSEFNLSDSNGYLSGLIDRIYTLLGIFMLFKVSFSLLQYIVSPDSFSDSSKGFGKLITNVMVALVLLVSVPMIFEKAMDIQSKIVTSNVIGTLILGSDNGDNTISTGDGINDQQLEIMAKDVQFLMFGAFYSLNTTLPDFSSCKSDNGNAAVFGSKQMALVNDGACLEAVDSGISSYDDAASSGVSLKSFFKYQNENEPTTDQRNFGHFDRLLSWKSDEGTYVINYMPFISTACGIYVVLLLISFAVDVALRAIKLCFLQMVAPIAIVSYVDPKESINNGKLYNWIKECGKTYFSLFLRLAVIFFVILLVSVIANSIFAEDASLPAQANSSGMAIWIYLFLVLGAFMFAKQVPGMIESIFGIKGSGDLNLNPFKNTGMAALTGGAVGLGLGVVGAATGSGVGRVLTGTVGGFKDGLGGKQMKEVFGSQADNNRRMGMAKANGSTFWGRQGARFSSLLGTPGAMGRIINQKRKYENQIQNYENAKQQIENEIAPTRMAIAQNSATASAVDAIRARATKKIREGNGQEGREYQEMLRRAAAAETSGNGEEAERLRQEAERKLNTTWADSWVTTNLNDENGDKGVQSLYAKAEATAKISGHELSKDGKALDSLSKQISGENTQREISISAQEQNIKEIDDQIRDVRVQMSDLNESEQKARADIEAVHGKEGGPRGRMGGPGGPRGPRGPRP